MCQQQISIKNLAHLESGQVTPPPPHYFYTFLPFVLLWATVWYFCAFKMNLDFRSFVLFFSHLFGDHCNIMISVLCFLTCRVLNCQWKNSAFVTETQGNSICLPKSWLEFWVNSKGHATGPSSTRFLCFPLSSNKCWNVLSSSKLLLLASRTWLAI
jgi:hypothetical protein